MNELRLHVLIGRKITFNIAHEFILHQRRNINSCVDSIAFVRIDFGNRTKALHRAHQTY